MARSLMEVFDDAFQREIKQARTYPEAYEKATMAFEKDHGFPAFSSYDAYRMRKKRKRK